MYLSKLELHGFKSFAQKTTLTFDPGVTAIVGPNGCGKSNVIDAVRWVLGEQRARLLRSDRMENVIFNGTSKRRALGLSEVSLTIENTRGVLPTEYSEVTITRRLYRSGESEYLLNGTVCRLKDILDLFMDTGMGAGAYSVIELKMIEDILSDNAADRRRLFEEAAGVTKYKMRRRQALGKLDSTQADLTRLADLTDEVERTVRSLQRQAQKAARHQRLADRLLLLELALAAWDYEQMAEEHRTLDRDSRHLRTQVEALTTQVGQGEATLEQQRTGLVGREQALSQRQQLLNAHTDTVRQLEAETRVGAERRASDTRALDRLARESEADYLRRQELTREEDTARRQLATAEQARMEAEAAEAEAKTIRASAAASAEQARAALTAARTAAANANKRAADARAALDRLLDRRALREQELDRLDAEFAAFADRIAEATEADRVTEEEATRTKAALAEADGALAQARTAHEAARAAAESAEQSARDARLARDTARAELGLLQSLVAEGDGSSSAIAFLADHEDWNEPLLTVSDVLGCEPEDAVAIETALGEWATCLVVETEAAAQEAIARLRVAEAGRATFFVLDRLPSKPHPERSGTPPGSRGAIQATRVPDERYDRLQRLLLQNVFIVDTLDEARRLRDDYPVARFVTRTGEWTSARGIVAGGSGQTNRTVTSRLGRQERMDALEATLADAEQHLTTAEAAVTEARAALEGSDLDALEAARDAARTAFDAARSTQARAQANRLSLDEQHNAVEARRTTLRAAWDTEPEPGDLQAAADAQAEEAQQAHTDRETAEAAFETAEADRQEMEAAYTEARLALIHASNAVEGLRRDLDRIQQTLSELDRRAIARSEEGDRLRGSIAESEATETALAARLDSARTDTDALQRAATEAEQRVLEARAFIADTEKTLRGIRQQREEALQGQNAADLRLTEIITRQDAIAERLEDEHGLTLEAAAARLPEAMGEDDTFDSDSARAEIPRLRDQIRTLGAVNALALESYEEEQERLTFLKSQQADLQAAEQTLLNTIEEINTTASQRFDETFEAVRTAFQRLFADLFGENATADLILNGDDPLEAPVEITARPKGKKPSTINQLSGGEKTLTAIALLFAIYLVKPSPFCILDEVDAPLDDANIARFMDLIRSFSDSTQFILVTHNKLTMEAADRMYGITMPEAGVSRLVGVRFDEATVEGDVPSATA